jgi:hypothetical protein
VHADIHDEAARRDVIRPRREVLAALHLNREWPADGARRDQPRKLTEPGVVAAVIGEAYHEVRV